MRLSGNKKLLADSLIHASSLIICFVCRYRPSCTPALLFVLTTLQIYNILKPKIKRQIDKINDNLTYLQLKLTHTFYNKTDLFTIVNKQKGIPGNCRNAFKTKKATTMTR